jgi:hypothetical protein
MHTAEGELFREALRFGCEASGLAVSGIKERELFGHAAASLGVAPDEVDRRVTALGKIIGPPWTQDEKLCALAGWLVLSNCAKVKV